MQSATLCLCLCFAGKGTVNGFAGTRLLLSPTAASSSRKNTAEFMSSEEFYGTAKAKAEADLVQAKDDKEPTKIGKNMRNQHF